jgi:hypothetical protein
MKNFLFSMLAVVWTCSTSLAQSKVFKEVNDEISSQVATLIQDHAVIGYIAFTRLEKATEELYNYKISIMDENLNDIGNVSFKDKPLILHGIAFEQDVLCLSYFRSNMLDKRYKREKKLNADYGSFKNEVMLQFLNLDGKILETVTQPVDIKLKNALFSDGYGAKGTLKNHQLISVPQTGFACFVGDEKKNQLSIYQPSGKKITQQLVKDDVLPSIKMVSSGSNIYLMADGANNKNIRSNREPNSYGLINYSIKDSSFSKVTIKDKQDHQLSILQFDIDPASGYPYLSGFIRGRRKSSNTYTVKGIAKGYYAGLFSISLTGNGPKSVKESFTYWDDASKPDISSKGYFRDQKSYSQIYSSFRDYAGNTYFIADGIVKKVKPGAIASSIIFAPLITVSPMILVLAGTSKVKVGEPLLMKMDQKGSLSWTNPIKGENYGYVRANYPLGMVGRRTYHIAMNHDQKQQFLVVNEKESSSIYNVNTKKLVRTVSLKDKNVSRTVYPAKEGYIMISEYNKKEKSTRISIEAL